MAVACEVAGEGRIESRKRKFRGPMGKSNRFKGKEEYEIREQIGSGAAAVVFKCVTLLNGKEEEFAVKIIDLRSLRLQSDHDRERVKLRREVSILQRMRHSYIVNLHEVVESQDELYLVMELVRFGELFYRIVEKKALAEDESRYVFMQVLEAVGYMHSMEVIHRDIKPENILISADLGTGFFHVKVADFGLAKLVSGGKSVARTFVGTPQYWAPEVIDAANSGSSYGAATDLWSLGVLLYVMLGGTYPFDTRKGPVELQIRKGDYHFRYPAFQSVSSSAIHLIRRLMTVSVEKRISLAEVFSHPWLCDASALERLPPMPPILKGTGHSALAVIPLSNSILMSNSMENDCMNSATPPEDQVVDGKTVTVPSYLYYNNSGHTAMQLKPWAEPYGLAKWQIGSKSCSSSAQEVVTGIPFVEEVSNPKKRLMPEDVMKSQRDRRSGDDQSNTNQAAESVFSFRDLFDLQISIASRLELAWLAFRDDPVISRVIRDSSLRCRERHMASTEVIRRFASTCDSVVELLPELQMAVSLNTPNLGMDLMELVHSWVKNMRSEAIKIQEDYTSMIHEINRVIELAREAKVKKDVLISEQASPQNSTTASAADVSAAALQLIPYGQNMFSSSFKEFGYEAVRNNLFDQLNAVYEEQREQSPPETTCSREKGGTNPERQYESSRGREHLTEELMDLLFMTPGVLHLSHNSDLGSLKNVADMKKQAPDYSSSASKRTPTMVVDPNRRIDSVGSRSSVSSETGKRMHGEPMQLDGTPSRTMTAQSKAQPVSEDEKMISPVAACNSKPGKLVRQSEILLKALNELRKVDKILERCVRFWGGIDCTIERLSQMKERTEKLINYVHKEVFRQRFEQKMTEYECFWAQLRQLCHDYVRDASCRMDRIYEFLSHVSQTADSVDSFRALCSSELTNQTLYCPK